MVKKLSEEERNRLSEQLIRLGDFLAEDDEWGSTRKQVERDYKHIMNLLYPETKPKRVKTKLRTITCPNCGLSRNKRIKLSVEQLTINCQCGNKFVLNYKKED